MPIYIGTKEKGGSTVTIQESDRRKHCSIFGKSGCGKTTLIRNMALADIYAGNGVTVIDPHGALIEDLLENIPGHRRKDVIYINPSHPTRVIGLNVLQAVAKDQHPRVVSSLISIMRNLWPSNWGPRTEYILSHAVYALLEQREPVTLAALPKLLTDNNYRKRIVSNVTDPAVLSFFHFYETQNDRLREESIAPLLNKVSAFITNPLLRAVIGQTTSSFDFREAMDCKKIILCSLSRGALGADVSSLLGSLIVTKLALASLTRQDIPETERQPHYLYCDEIQTFGLGVDFPTILSESRKYALALTLGTQTLAVLPEQTVASIFGNCGTIVSFRVSGEDASVLVSEFGVTGDLGKQHEEDYFCTELQNLPDYKLYLRTLSDGEPREPFLATSFPPFPKNGKEMDAEMIIRTSLERYGRDRKKVEDRIGRFLAM
jgi:type IV secretory pathway TraG/TraD family ATPase VirD4